MHLGKLYLGFTLTALGMLAKDVQDDCGAVNDFHLHLVFQRTALGGGKFCICHDGVCTKCSNEISKFLSLSSTEVGCRIWHGTHLHDTVKNLSTCRFAQRCQFTHRVLAVFYLPLGINPNEDNVFESNLAVLNLGNIFQLSGKTLHSA